MTTALLAVHFTFSALWLGCVLTEALFERALLAGDRAAHRTLADLHVRVDKFIEIPSIVLVLVSGVWLSALHFPSGTYFYTMLIAGCVAVVANGYCVWLVFRRRDAAHALRWEEFDKLDHLQHKVGGIVLLGLVTAIMFGVLAHS